MLQQIRLLSCGISSEVAYVWRNRPVPSRRSTGTTILSGTSGSILARIQRCCANGVDAI